MLTNWSYSQTFRVIGQSFEDLGVQDFHLWPADDVIIVRYTQRALAHQSWLDRLRSRPREQHEQLIEIQYNRRKLLWLQIAGESMRVRDDQVPDYFRISQTLRTIGVYLDRASMRFLSLKRSGETFYLEFSEWSGKKRVEEHGLGSFENYFMHTYLRGRKAKPSHAGAGL